MTGDRNLLRDGLVATATFGVVFLFAELPLPGILTYVAQLVAAVAGSAFVLRAMRIL